MPVTRDKDFSPSIAQLVQSFNHCANGHDMIDVVEAAGNMFSAAIHNYAAAQGMTEDGVKDFARRACHGVFASVELNWRRKRRTTDVEVKPQ